MVCLFFNKELIDWFTCLQTVTYPSIPEQMGLQQLFKLSETVALPQMDWQPVPQAWSSSRKSPVAETIIWMSNNAHHCVGRSESARADVGRKPTVVCRLEIILLTYLLTDWACCRATMLDQCLATKSCCQHCTNQQQHIIEAMCLIICRSTFSTCW